MSCTDFKLHVHHRLRLTPRIMEDLAVFLTQVITVPNVFGSSAKPEALEYVPFLHTKHRPELLAPDIYIQFQLLNDIESACLALHK
jgi:hypothetical protein